MSIMTIKNKAEWNYKVNVYFVREKMFEAMEKETLFYF